MVMYFQDDFWDAVCELESEEDANEAIAALVRYHYDKSYKPTNPTAKAILTVCKKRIDLSQTRSKAGSKRKQKDSKTQSKPEQTQSNASLSLSNSNSVSNTYQVDIQPDITNMLKHGDDYGETWEFAYQCIAAWETMTGKICGDLRPEHMRTVEKYKDVYSLDDVKAMFEMKRKEWMGTKFYKNFHPSTLFKSDLFNKYMGQLEYERENPKPSFISDEPRHGDLELREDGSMYEWDAHAKEWHLFDPEPLPN